MEVEDRVVARPLGVGNKPGVDELVHDSAQLWEADRLRQHEGRDRDQIANVGGDVEQLRLPPIVAQGETLRGREDRERHPRDRRQCQSPVPEPLTLRPGQVKRPRHAGVRAVIERMRVGGSHGNKSPSPTPAARVNFGAVRAFQALRRLARTAGEGTRRVGSARLIVLGFPAAPAGQACRGALHHPGAGGDPESGLRGSKTPGHHRDAERCRAAGEVRVARPPHQRPGRRPAVLLRVVRMGVPTERFGGLHRGDPGRPADRGHPRQPRKEVGAGSRSVFAFFRAANAY